MATIVTKDRWSMCYGIVKTKLPTKKENVWSFNAKDYESAIRQIKKYAQSNYRDNHKEATLFLNGNVVGWAFRTDGKIIYVDKWTLIHIGLLPAPRK